MLCALLLLGPAPARPLGSSSILSTAPFAQICLTNIRHLCRSKRDSYQSNKPSFFRYTETALSQSLFTMAALSLEAQGELPSSQQQQQQHSQSSEGKQAAPAPGIDGVWQPPHMSMLACDPQSASNSIGLPQFVSPAQPSLGSCLTR